MFHFKLVHNTYVHYVLKRNETSFKNQQIWMLN